MHELGLCDALLRMIRKILADEEDVTRVSRVTLEAVPFWLYTQIITA